MDDYSRRGLFSVVAGAFAALVPGGVLAAVPPNPFLAITGGRECRASGRLMRQALIDEVGLERLRNNTFDLEDYRDGVLTVSVVVRFYRDWIVLRHPGDWLRAAQRVHSDVKRVEVGFRVPGSCRPRTLEFSAYAA